MVRPLDPFRFVLIAVSGWMNQHQRQVIDYLREENRASRAVWVDVASVSAIDQCQRLAAKAQLLGRRILAEVDTQTGRAGWGTLPASGGDSKRHLANGRSTAPGRTRHHIAFVQGTCDGLSLPLEGGF
jgi:hypothetical protein